jgi:hypothetical protein
MPRRPRHRSGARQDRSRRRSTGCGRRVVTPRPPRFRRRRRQDPAHRATPSPGNARHRVLDQHAGRIPAELPLHRHSLFGHCRSRDHYWCRAKLLARPIDRARNKCRRVGDRNSVEIEHRHVRARSQVVPASRASTTRPAPPPHPATSAARLDRPAPATDQHAGNPVAVPSRRRSRR